MAIFDNIVEALFEGGSTHQESINIFLLNEVPSILFGYATTVNDTHIIWLGNRVVECFPQPTVNLLSLFGSGRQSCSDGPHWFVGKHNIIVPGLLIIEFLHYFLKRFELSGDD